MAKQVHSTKCGPGRVHKDGTPHGRPPVAPKGAFAGQHTNPEKNAARKLKRSLGARWVRISTKLARRAAKLGGPSVEA